MITVEVQVKELDTRETFTFTVEGEKVHPPKGAFVDQANGQVVLGFGVKITLEKPP